PRRSTDRPPARRIRCRRRRASWTATHTDALLGSQFNDLAHAIDRLCLRLVVRAHEHLAEEPDRHELDPDDDHEDREQHDGTVGEPHAEHEAFETELGGQQESRAGTHEAKKAEELDRPRRGVRQPFTTSTSPWNAARRRGMSRGSFCRSASIEMMMPPRACSIPAASAAVWP